MGRTRVGVLASGRGTDFQSLVDARKRGDLDIDLAVLVCNVPGAPVLDRAKAAGVPAVVVDHRPFGKDREAFEQAMLKVLRDKRVELVVFAGFMRLVSASFIRAFPDRIINIHPSLLPAFPGAHAHRDAIAAGVKVSGCTIHFVDASVDGGPSSCRGRSRSTRTTRRIPSPPGSSSRSTSSCRSRCGSSQKAGFTWKAVAFASTPGESRSHRWPSQRDEPQNKGPSRDPERPRC